ncbi:MAG: IclR family transcriptional regulator [Actinomycetota bacterium]|jgi:DNA-binding IclR family transcriptional regulator|nr:IclR family transcriptional regulator [Actinomycetota bacterium]
MSQIRETSLRRGIAILEALASDHAVRNGGLRVTDLVEVVGREKSQVSRTLRTLADLGLVERDDGLRHRLSWRFYLLGAHGGRLRLLEQASPLLRHLVDELGERAHLSVLQDDQVLTLLSESSPHSVQAAGWSGRTVPCWCTASGRALLFDHDEGSLAALCADTDFSGRGPNAPSSVAELHERIRQARERGVAVVVDEFEEGLVAVAAPVRDVDGRLVAVLNVSGPTFRLSPGLVAAATAVADAARDLTRALGPTR